MNMYINFQDKSYLLVPLTQEVLKDITDTIRTQGFNGPWTYLNGDKFPIIVNLGKVTHLQLGSL